MKQPADLPRKTGRPLSFDRDAALQSAMLAFWRHGYETTSLSELTAAMGITPPSLYAAFGDKKQLFLEAVRLYAGAPEDIEQALRQAATAREAAEILLLGAVTRFTGEKTPRGCMLASATASGSETAADVQATVAAIRQTILARLAERIRQDVVYGLLPGDTDENALAALVITVIQGLSVLARDGADRALLQTVAETALCAWPAPPRARA